MEIDINQTKISIGDKYKIFIDGQQAYYASRQLFQLFPTIKLFENAAGEEARMTINRQFFFLKAKYVLIRRNTNIFQFRTKSFWKHHFQCQVGSDNYDLYGHRGRKYSIYKNDIQVAWWDKNAVSWFSGDNYKITADKDCDVALIIFFCLIIDNFSYHKKSIFNYSFGNIGFQAKMFDPAWQPKS